MHLSRHFNSPRAHIHTHARAHIHTHIVWKKKHTRKKKNGVVVVVFSTNGVENDYYALSEQQQQLSIEKDDIVYNGFIITKRFFTVGERKNSKIIIE